MDLLLESLGSILDKQAYVVANAVLDISSLDDGTTLLSACVGAGIPQGRALRSSLGELQPTILWVHAGIETAGGAALLRMPHTTTHGLWESLVFDDGCNITSRLTRYVAWATGPLAAANPDLLPSQRLVLLYGSPGCGKSSLARGLAHKISGDHPGTALLEVSCAALFSKFLGESARALVTLFDAAKKLAAEAPQGIIVVVIDEVESIGGTRAALTAAGGADAGEGVRVVNALLTSLDRMRNSPNIVVVATSNLATCSGLDPALLDRCDLKLVVTPPSLATRTKILDSAVSELVRLGVITGGGGGGARRGRAGVCHPRLVGAGAAEAAAGRPAAERPRANVGSGVYHRRAGSGGARGGRAHRAGHG